MNDYRNKKKSTYQTELLSNWLRKSRSLKNNHSLYETCFCLTLDTKEKN